MVERFCKTDLAIYVAVAVAVGLVLWYILSRPDARNEDFSQGSEGSVSSTNESVSYTPPRYTPANNPPVGIILPTTYNEVLIKIFADIVEDDRTYITTQCTIPDGELYSEVSQDILKIIKKTLINRLKRHITKIDAPTIVAPLEGEDFALLDIVAVTDSSDCIKLNFILHHKVRRFSLSVRSEVVVSSGSVLFKSLEVVNPDMMQVKTEKHPTIPKLDSTIGITYPTELDTVLENLQPPPETPYNIWALTGTQPYTKETFVSANMSDLGKPSDVLRL